MHIRFAVPRRLIGAVAVAALATIGLIAPPPGVAHAAGSGPVSYGYDPAGRLVGASRAGAGSVSYG